MENASDSPPTEEDNSEILDFIRELVTGPSKGGEPGMRPSRFRDEMKLTTEDRINKYKSLVCKSKNSAKFPIFEPIPETVIFQNYKVGVGYTASLTIRNNSNLSKPLRPIFPPSSYLTVIYASEAISIHIAPGMALTFHVQFCTEEKKDYKFVLKFVTESEVLTVPVYAVTPRPLLDIPDCVQIPTSVIRIPSEESVYIRNQAVVPATFFNIIEGPFEVKPDKGILQTGDVMRLSVIFTPTRLGKSHGKLLLTYDSGETLWITLEGCAKEANIYLEKGSLNFGETFIGLTRQKSLTLTNNSKYLVNFEWKLYVSDKEEMDHLDKLKESMSHMKENEASKSNKLQHLDIIDAEGHSKVYERIYTDETSELETGNRLLFQNPYFRIVPLRGEVWPNAKFTFTIFFAPMRVGRYNSTAYLYITGRDQRVRLLLNGLALGPSIDLNMTTLDVNKLYMCSVHQYEIVARNKGDIPGAVRFVSQELEFGGTMSCEPELIPLEPGKCGRFVITFSSREQGTFIEEILFNIQESQQVLGVIFTGEIDCPYLSFEEYDIDFGTVPIGDPIRKQIVMTNSSLVPICYKLSVQGDGDIPSVTCAEYASLPVRCGLSKRPREFDYSQRSGSVPPNSCFHMELTLTANIVRHRTTALIIKMWDSDKHIISLPLSYAASVPKVTCIPPEVNIRFCFLSYPYHRNVLLHNETPLSGYIEIDASSQSTRNGIQCTASQSACFIKPHQDIELNLVIIMSIAEQDRLPIYVTPLGGQKTQCCSIVCYGQGPVLTASTDEVNFGKVNLLTCVMQDLTVSNDSPIPAIASISLSPKSHFSIEPQTFALNIDESKTLSISVYMTSPGSVVDKLAISVTDGNTNEVTLKAKGVGTCIQSVPALVPSINFDVLMTYQEFSFAVTFVNRGKKWHRLYWSRNKHLKQMREAPNEMLPSAFSFCPAAIDLHPAQKCTVAIKGFNKVPCYVNEDFYCHALLEKATHQEVIMSCNIIATFVEPCVELNKTQMNFVKNVGVDSVYEFLSDELEMINHTPLGITMNILAKDPFCIVIQDEDVSMHSVSLAPEESYRILIKFRPYDNDNRCKSIHDRLQLDYLEHPKIDAIDLIGEVNYPNILIYPSTIAFAIPPDSTAWVDVLLRNISPLLAHYSFEWQEECFYVNELIPQETSVLPPKDKLLEICSDSDTHFELDEKATSEYLLKIVDLEKSSEEQLKPPLPMIYYYQRAYVEQYQVHSFVQLSYALESSTERNLTFPEENLQNLTEMCSLFHTATNYNEEQLNHQAIQTLPSCRRKAHIISKLLNITPSSGTLQPHEWQTVAITLQPISNTFLAAEVVCHVRGGPSEVIKLEAVSADLSYNIETLSVDFGRQVFCETVERTVSVKNTCPIPFTFNITFNETSELPTYNLTVNPQQGKLNPGEIGKFKVKHVAGTTGKFSTLFNLKVGYLPKQTVDVHGFGDCPQIYLGDRKSLRNVSPNISYSAIASITPQYLKTLKNLNYTKRLLNQERFGDDLSKSVLKTLKMESWVVISYRDLFPSPMDIDLAVERTILHHHLASYPVVLSKHTKVHKATVVPEFLVPNYLVDFGFVIVGDQVVHTTKVFNYGPTTTFIKVTAGGGKLILTDFGGVHIDSNKFNVQVGRMKEISIHFHPTQEIYKELDKELVYEVCLDVSHGARIPLSIRATVTVPRLTSNTSQLHFGEVRCGDIKRRSLILTNSGFVPCCYTAAVNQKEQKTKWKNEHNPPKNVFFTHFIQDTVNPGCQKLLDIYFEPQVDGVINSHITVSIEKNPEKLRIGLKGVGKMPRIKITDEVIQFDPALPYAPLCFQNVTIENTSAVPIEFYFTDFDLAIDKEEKMIDLLTEYYVSNQLTIPPRRPGQTLPKQFYEFYENVLDSLHKKLIKDSMNSADAKHTNSLDSSAQTITSGKRHSHLKNSSPVRSESLDITNMESASCLLPKDPAQLHLLLKEHLEEFVQQEKTKVDPVADAIAEYQHSIEKKQPPRINEGVFLIFHGYQTTDYIRSSYKVGLELSVPVYSIDKLLMEAIAECSTMVAVTVKNIIENQYKLIAQHHDVTELSNYEVLELQVNCILEDQLKPKGSKKGSKKGKKSSAKGTATFLGISEVLLLDALKSKLQALKTGIVVESLNSIFIKPPLQALTFLLKAIGNARYIHFFILAFNYNQSNHFNATQEIAREEKKVKDRQAQLSRILQLSTEKLTTLSADDYEIYATYYLKERRQRTLCKRENLQRKGLAPPAKIKRKEHPQKTSKKDEALPSNTKKGTSKTSSGKKGSSRGSSKSRDGLNIKKTFETFESELKQILHLLAYWDRKTCTCTKSLPQRGTSKSAKSSKTSKTSSKKGSKAKSAKGAVLPVVIPDPVDFSNLTPERELYILQNDVPCWVIENAHPHKPVEVLLSQYLKQVSDLIKAEASLAESLKEHVKETVVVRSVLTKTYEPTVKNMSTVFFVRDTLEANDPIEISSAIDTRKKTSSRLSTAKSSKGSKVKIKSALSTLAELPSALDQAILNDDKFTTRMVLKPGGSVTYRLLFKPEQVGLYVHTFTLQVVGWPTPYFLTCEGNCDIPRLNMTPENIFPKVLKKRTKKTLYHNCIYLSKDEVFDFGPILAQNMVDPIKLAMGTEFNLTNVSLITCEASFITRFKPNSFAIEEDTIAILPGSTEVLNMKAIASEVAETNEDQLLISIKDNPEIFSINLRSESSLLSFAVGSKSVRFERILINDTEERTLVLQNLSFVPLAWQLVNFQSILEKFTISPLQGYIEPCTTQNVNLQFYSPVKLIVPDQLMKIEVYDADYKSPIPLHLQTINVGAEAIQVSIDCPRTLNLSEVKGQKKLNIPYTFISTGKYGVEFTFLPISKNEDPNKNQRKAMRSYFTATPSSGILKTNTPFDIDIMFLATKPIKVKDAPVYKVTFVDQVFKKFIDSFLLTVTLKTEFSLFELFPPIELNFGYQLLGIDATQTITVSNCGKFDFDYQVLSLKAVLEQRNKPTSSEKSLKKKGSSKSGKGSKKEKSEKASKKGKSEKASKKGKSEKASKKGKSEKGGSKAKIITTLAVGQFTLTPSSGTVKAGKVATIFVTARSNRLGPAKEVVVVKISETEDADKDGRQITLSITTSLPTVNFSDYDAIFREQFVVDSVTAFESSGSTDTKAVFIKNEKRLHFPNVPINTKAQARIRLENVSPVPADLQCVVRSQKESSFTIAPARVNIEPYSTNYTTVTYQPSSIERMEGSLDIQYYGVDASYNANRLQITLSGEGVVPEVAIASPKYDSSIGCYVINFSPTFISDTATDNITIQNIGGIPCQVILEVSDDTMNVFSIAAHPHTKPKLKIQDDEGVSHTNLVYLNVGELGEFYLQFQPHFPENFSCVVKLHIINNPYETRMIAVTGLGYTNSVRLKDLDTCAIIKSSSSNLMLQEDIIAYTIEFGALAVNKPYRECFKIVNTSPTQTYKFEFTNWDKISFIPTRGHLNPGACKDVIATFMCKEPCTLQKIPLLCNLCQIEYVDPQIELLSWDDRQTVVLWEGQNCLSSVSVLEQKAVSGSKIDVKRPNSSSTTKIIKDKDEPSTNIIPDTTKSLSILISATCDYCSYKASSDEIEFPDTFAFERQTATFEITNTSNINLKVRWNITIEKNLKMNSPVEDPSSNTFEVTPKPKKTSRPCHLSGAEKFLYNDSPSDRSAKFSLFSEETNTSWLDDDTPPFDVTPNPASVAPMAKKEFTITFSPKSIAEYLAHVTSNISNLHPFLGQLDIEIKANSLLPAFYFNIEASDYVANRRKVSVACGDLVNENTEVLEFQAVGLTVAVERSFYVVNPTEQTLLYKWAEAFPSTSEVSLFYCYKPQGLIEKGKKASITFSFMPPSTGTFEAFYIFSVDKHKFTKTFLMVGHAREPNVFFDNPYLQIRPSVIGVDITQSTCIKNNEDFEINFKFEKESTYGDAHQQKLTVVPLKGEIGPYQEKKISITFHPVKVGEVGFNLKCVITKMKNPLPLTVSATCYEIQSQVFYETGVGKKVFLHPSEPNMLELKSLAPLLTQDIIFTMTNIGEVGFYYAWILKEDLTTNKVDIIFEDGSGFVPISSEKSMRMCVTPLTNVSIKNTIIKLQIRYGPTYTIYLSGATSLPFFNFSVNDYNFGTCLVQQEVTDYYKTIVEFSNGDDAPITLECKQPEVDFLTVKFKSKHVQGRQTEPIEVHFHPFKVQTHMIYVTFYVNSRPHELCFRGEGVANSVRLVNFSDKFLNFGEVAVGGSSKRAVSVLNNSDACIDIIFDLPDRLPIFSRPKKTLEPQYEPGIKSSNKSKQSPGLGKTDCPLVTIVPKKFTRVPPHQTTQFISTYSPTERIKTFSGKIAYQVQDIVETLCTFKGSCVGPDYTLDKSIISFGCVVLGYSNKQKVMLNNVGDVGGAFKWTFEKYYPYFTITPEHGFVSPGNSAVFTIQFKPPTLGTLFEAKIKCIIGGYKKYLEIQLSGSCIGMPPPVDRIEFECPVRSSTKRFINIENRSAQIWRVATTIEGQYFTSKNFYVLKPKSVLPCEVAYSPLTMTGNKLHQATIFFAYPEGIGVLYELSGRTTPPLVVDRIQREITCKKLHKETLIVKNWQKLPQAFEVITENSSQTKILYKLDGNPSIEVLGQSERPYTWSIYVLNEGTLQLKVMFRNKETKEYLYYEIILKILKSPPLDVITLNTCVRKSLTHSITLENPLSRPVTYTAKGTCPELTFVSPHTVPALSENTFVITFLPLTEGESEAHIDLTSSDLGIYPYDFKLTARAPVPDQQLFFIAKLGQTTTQRASVTNTSKTTTTLAAQFTDPTAFFLQSNVTVTPQATKEFLIHFEPYEIGTLKSVLTLHSPATGPYAFTLTGTCEPPKPQGPYFIIPGGSTSVTFKNPFLESTDFQLVVEPAIFSVKNDSQTVNGRCETKIAINLAPLQNLEILVDRKYSIAGKLTIYPTEERVAHIKWVYYLQGDLNT